MKMKSQSEVTQLCLTLSNPMDWSLPGSSTGEAIPLRGLEGVPGLPGAPQDEAGLMGKCDT